MDKENCRDKDGNSHFGSYGFMDGYNGTLSNCRCGLNSRRGSCSDVDSCMEEAHKKCVELQSNIISFNINNMVAGEKQRVKEASDDKKIAEAKRIKEKEEADKIKQEAENKKKEEETKKETSKEEPKKEEPKAEDKKEESKQEEKKDESKGSDENKEGK